MVGVGEHLLGDLKRLVKLHALVVDEQAQQLGDGDHGVGVVELDGVAVRKLGKVVPIHRLIPAQNVLEGCAGKEILLLEAQNFARFGVVVGVEHPRDVLRLVFLAQRFFVFLCVEQAEIERLHRLGLPQAQGVHAALAVAHHGHVVGHRVHRLVAEFHRHGVGLAAQAPRVALPLPVVGGFPLLAVHDRLFEQAVLVADAVTVERQVVGGRRIEVAGRQPPQSAVAQRRVLDLLQAGQIDPLVGQNGAHLVQHPHVVQIAEHQPPHQKFSGQIVSALAVGVAVPAPLPTGIERSARPAAQRKVELCRGGSLQRGLIFHLELFFQLRYQFFFFDHTRYLPHHRPITLLYRIPGPLCNGFPLIFGNSRAAKRPAGRCGGLPGACVSYGFRLRKMSPTRRSRNSQRPMKNRRP